MMGSQDILIVKESSGSFDIDFENGDLRASNGLETTIFTLLHSDKRATSDQILDPLRRRGWLGDTESRFNGFKIGSYIWLLNQRRLTQSTLNDAISFTRNALQILIDSNICTSIFVTGEIIPKKGIRLEVDVKVLSGEIKKTIIDLWESTEKISSFLDPVIWLLFSGVWNDLGVWDDFENWED